MSELVSVSGQPEAQTVLLPEGKADKRRLHPWAWAILAASASGAMMAACYWPLDLWFLAWVAMVPWLVVLPRLGTKTAWLMGTVLGLVFYRISFDWLFGIYGPLGGISIVVGAILMGYSFRIASLLMARFGMATMLWAVPIAFTGQEVLRSESLPLMRFSYVGWGYSQAHNVWIAQIASLGGVYSLTFLIVAFNVAVAYGILRRRAVCWAPAATLAAVMLALAVVSQPIDYSKLPRFTAACVQAEEEDNHIYKSLTRQALSHNPRPAVVVLPEHATVEAFNNDAENPLVEALAKTADEYDAYVCLGAHSMPKRKPVKCWFDNVGLLIGPDGQIALKQVKMVPAPFLLDGNPGSQQEELETPHGKVGVLVCMDSAYTDHPRRLVGMGAEFLLVPVFNHKEWPTQQQRQQEDMAVFRSVELRRCAVRGASSGVSMIVDATGRSGDQVLDSKLPGVLYRDIYAVSSRTIFARFGYVFPIMVTCAFLAIAVLLTLHEWIGYAVRLARFVFALARRLSPQNWKTAD